MSAVHPLRIPEHAIGVFEAQHGLHVTVHDLDGRLEPFLGPDRGHHCSVHCLAAKARVGQEPCLAFELDHLRPRLEGLEEGRIHVCHAGLVEWVVPVLRRGRAACVLFAGPRRPGPDLDAAGVHRERLSRAGRSPDWGNVPPPEVGAAEAGRLLEQLRQLAARLRAWMDRHLPEEGGVFSPSLARDLAGRARTIHGFLERHHAGPATLAMLARELGLSESRASHVVRASCGMSFRELLLQRRLRAARDLLARGGLTVGQVAAASGFEEIAHFYRLFRRRVGTTPAQYRLRGGS